MRFSLAEDGRKQRGRRITGPVRKVHDFSNLNEKQHEILNLTSLGLNRQQIAQAMEVTPQTVSNVTNSSLGKEKLSLLRGTRDANTLDTLERIQGLTEKALDVYDEIFEEDGVPRNLKLHAAKDVLDRAGFGAVKKIDLRSISGRLSEEDIKELKERGELARQLAAKRREVIDVNNLPNNG